MVQAGVDGMRFTVDSASNLCELLRNLDPSVAMTVEEESALLSLVGNGITSLTFVMQRALGPRLGARRHDIVRMLAKYQLRSSQGRGGRGGRAPVPGFRPIRRFLQPRRNRRAACPSSTGQPPSRGLAALPVTDFQKSS